MFNSSLKNTLSFDYLIGETGEAYCIAGNLWRFHPHDKKLSICVFRNDLFFGDIDSEIK